MVFPVSEPDFRTKSSILVALFDKGPSLEQVETVLRQMHIEYICPLRDRIEADRRIEASLALLNPDCPEALAQWRALARPVPTIILSEHMGFDARLAAARVGVDGVMQAPVDSDELAGWIKHFALREEKLAADILIVDDDEIAREMNAETLIDMGLNVTAVESAQQAFGHLQDQNVDLMLLDLRMPDIDGIEFARIVRQDLQHLSLPIVFLSGERDEAKQLEARRQGGDDFIVKPVTPDRLQQIVELRLERARDLQQLIEYDSLTGLLNHARFHSQLEMEMQRCRRIATDISVVLVDLDHFKSVNDAHGHQAGDRVIRSLATLLRNSLRKTDLVGRLGGEEFGAVMLDTDPVSAAAVIDHMREQLEAIQFTSDSGPFNVSFSAGIAGHADGLSASDLVGRADKLLYKAKEQGRGRTALSPEDSRKQFRAVGE